jgi:hypothetical protein
LNRTLAGVTIVAELAAADNRSGLGVLPGVETADRGAK